MSDVRAHPRWFAGGGLGLNLWGEVLTANLSYPPARPASTAAGYFASSPVLVTGSPGGELIIPLSVGVRETVSPSIDLQARLNLLVGLSMGGRDANGTATSIARPCLGYDGSSTCSDTLTYLPTGPEIELAPSLEGTARVRPISAASRWYLGAGLRLGVATWAGAGGEVEEHQGNTDGSPVVQKTPFSFGEAVFFAAPLIETGWLIGDREEYDLSFRCLTDLGVAGAPFNFDPELSVSLGWAFR